MRVAIMQPTYLPWLGYFGLMHSVDKFILLDSVQFARRSWQQRNQIKSADGALWLTVPVYTKGLRDQIISDVEIDYGHGFPFNHKKSLITNYAKAPFFRELSPSFFEILDSGEKRLSSLTVSLIKWARGLLGINTEMYLSSQLNPVGAKAELLAALCVEVGAKQYISPIGAKCYLDESSAFDREGISIQYFEFNYTVYPQKFGPFIPNMSIIDLLFNCGPESLSYIERGLISKI